MLFEPEFLEWAAASREQIKMERDRMHRALTRNLAPEIAHVYPSAGNFILISVRPDAAFSRLRRGLDEAQIKVLDTSGMPMLRNSLRISIGSYEANSEVIECILSALGQSCTTSYLSSTSLVSA